MTTSTDDTFSLKITGPGMTFEREIDPAIIPNLMQLAFGGASLASAAQPATPLWQPGADPRVDLDGASEGNITPAKKAAKKAAKKSGGKKLNYSATKDIDFAPDGKQSWMDFAAEKAPGSMLEKALVAVYYMQEIMGRPIAIGDVIAAFDVVAWSNPSDPANTLQQAGSKGWLETGDSNNVKAVWAGKNFVKNELPKATKSTK